ncbi:MAG: type II toxin-antitoxin system HicA family toxin [Acidobacteriota bacterium]
MSLLPMLTAGEVVAALARAGFEVVRQRGSHLILQHSDGRHTVVPAHKGEDVDRRLLRDILKQTGFTQPEFLVLLRK